jgi:SAM-dependent methyltransferase/uncharacterized protein YbaR (Trm112 family)
MQVRLLEILRCPLTLEPLKLEVLEEIRVDRESSRVIEQLPESAEDHNREIIEGYLVAETSGYRYPIINGVPRLLADTRLEAPTGLTESSSFPDRALSEEYRQTVEHFRTQWENYAQEDKVFGRDVEGSWKYFRDTLCPPEVPDSWFEGRLVLDAGCGHGKFVDALSKRGIEIVAFDITPEVERVFSKLSGRPNAHVIQANILHPPFAPGTFDYVFSNGVIHHTPDTRAAFRSIGRLVRAGGYLGVWVYPFRSVVFDTVSQSIRFFTTRMPRWLLRQLCFIPVPLLSIPGWEAYSKTSLRNASWRECAQVVYDFFGPKYQTHHTAEELSRWYREEGFANPWIGPDPLSAAGRKSAAT